MHEGEDVWASRLKAAQESKHEENGTKQINSEYAEVRSDSENPDFIQGNLALRQDFFSFSSAFRMVKKRKTASEEITSRDCASKTAKKSLFKR